MLQGTFETLSLPEVLGLLASARKSGALWIDAGAMQGVIHVEDGHCRAVELGERRHPVDDGGALLDRLVEVCFAVVRQEKGAFRFAADESSPWMCPEPVELSDALVEVERLLKQWREIRRVIPSLDCRPRLLDALVVDEVVLDRERWTVLVAIDGRRSVREIVERTSRPVLDVCHVLLELVEAGAAGIDDPSSARTLDEPGAEPVVAPPPIEAPTVETVAPPAAVEPVAPQPESAPTPEAPRVEPEPEPAPAPEPPRAEPAPEAAPPTFAPPPVAAPEPVPAPPAAEAEPPAGEPSREAVGVSGSTDRGAYLRLFSGLRDS